MKKKLIIGKQGEHVGYIIQTGGGIIHIDNLGNWWLGGTADDNGIALFGHRDDAIRTAKKIRGQRPDLIEWTKTLPVFYCVA